jgi:hypothetical protein
VVYYLNSTRETVEPFYSKIKDVPSDMLILRQTPGIINKPEGDIIESIANGKAVKMLTTSNNFYQSYVDVDGYRWYQKQL